MIKKCPKCQIEKNIEYFNKNKTNKDGLQRICRDCAKQEHYKWYNDNKDVQIEKNKKVRENNKTWYKELKKQYICEKCGDDRWYVLDFHHLDPDGKEFNLGDLGYNSRKKTLKELKKCIALCRNCHSEFHFLEKENKIKINEYLNNNLTL